MKQMKHKHRMRNLTDSAPNNESTFAFLNDVPGGVLLPGTFFYTACSEDGPGVKLSELTIFI